MKNASFKSQSRCVHIRMKSNNIGVINILVYTELDKLFIVRQHPKRRNRSRFQSKLFHQQCWRAKG